MDNEMIVVKQHIASIDCDIKNIMEALSELKLQSRERSQILNKIDKSTDNIQFRVTQLEKQTDELKKTAEDYKCNKWKTYGIMTGLSTAGAILFQIIFKL